MHALYLYSQFSTVINNLHFSNSITKRGTDLRLEINQASRSLYTHDIIYVTHVNRTVGFTGNSHMIDSPNELIPEKK